MQKKTVNKLDRIFSKFIRLRDSDDNGYGKCISCGKIVHWQDADCGHYINRKHLSTRWCEKNCNLQCRSCNRFQEGNAAGYTLGLIKKYGGTIIEELIAKKMGIYKLTDFEGEILYKEYLKKVKECNKK